MSLESISALQCGNNASAKSPESQDSTDRQRLDSHLSLSIDGKPGGGSGGTEAMSVVKAASSTSKDSPMPHMYHGAASRVRMQESSATTPTRGEVAQSLAILCLASCWVALSIV